MAGTSTNGRPLGWPQDNLRRAVEALRLCRSPDNCVIVTVIAAALLRDERDLTALVAAHYKKEKADDGQHILA